MSVDLTASSPSIRNHPALSRGSTPLSPSFARNATLRPSLRPRAANMRGNHIARCDCMYTQYSMHVSHPLARPRSDYRRRVHNARPLDRPLLSPLSSFFKRSPARRVRVQGAASAPRGSPPRLWAAPDRRERQWGRDERNHLRLRASSHHPVAPEGTLTNTGTTENNAALLWEQRSPAG